MPTLPDVNAVLAFLKRIDLCRGLNGQALGEIAFILLPIHAAEDEALIEEGDSGRAAFILYSGRLQVVKAGEAIGVIEPGEMFGEMSLLDAEPRSATLVPQEPSILLRLDPDSFDAMLAAGNAALLRLMLNVLQQQVGRMRHLIDGRSAGPSPTTAVS